MTTFNLGEEERLPAGVTDRAIVVRFYVERADRRNPDKLCPDRGAKAEPRRDGDAHASIGTRPNTHHDFLRLTEAFQTEAHIFKKSARVFSIGRKTDVEQSCAVIAQRDASLCPRHLQREGFHRAFPSSITRVFSSRPSHDSHFA